MVSVGRTFDTGLKVHMMGMGTVSVTVFPAVSTVCLLNIVSIEEPMGASLTVLIVILLPVGP